MNTVVVLFVISTSFSGTTAKEVMRFETLAACEGAVAVFQPHAPRDIFRCVDKVIAK